MMKSGKCLSEEGLLKSMAKSNSEDGLPGTLFIDFNILPDFIT